MPTSLDAVMSYHRAAPPGANQVAADSAATTPAVRLPSAATSTTAATRTRAA
ncbi:hypothetical protein [Streptomyces sp. NPDC005799]|uniref:hypothetical protein n=1 Tax=Streptomyces sp. NPDC005799 TaxID=3154678 RepID=UPI0033EA686D